MFTLLKHSRSVKLGLAKAVFVTTNTNAKRKAVPYSGQEKSPHRNVERGHLVLSPLYLPEFLFTLADIKIN